MSFLKQGLISRILQSVASTELSTLVFAFSFGLAIGTGSKDLRWIIIWIIISEIIIYCLSDNFFPKYRLLLRLAVNSVAIFGIAIGNWLAFGKEGFDSVLLLKPEKERIRIRGFKYFWRLLRAGI